MANGNKFIDDVKTITDIDDRLNTLETYGIYTSLADLKNAKAGNFPYTLITNKGTFNYTYTTGNFSSKVDNVNIIALNSVSAASGALVRTGIEDAMDINVFATGPLDGSVDQGDNLQRAIDSAIALGYRKIVAGGNWGNGNRIINFKGLSVIGNPGGFTITQLSDIDEDETIPGGAHQGQNIQITANASISNLTLDCNGFKGGVVCSGQANISLENVRVVNGPLPPENATFEQEMQTGCQAFQFLGCLVVRMTNCYTKQVQFSTQIWRCNDVQIKGGTFEQSAAGIFLAGTINAIVEGVTCNDHVDVGIDVEGGSNVNVGGCLSKSSGSAELAIFADQTVSDPSQRIGNLDTLMSDNTVHRTPTYKNRRGVQVPVNQSTGAIWIASLSEGAKSVAVNDNQVRVEQNSGHLWKIDDWGTTTRQDLAISKNRFRFEGTGEWCNISTRAPGFEYSDNNHIFTASVTNSGIFKNIGGGRVEGNTFTCLATPTQPLVKFYTDETQLEFSVARNTFVGSDSLACAIDLYVAGNYACVLSENSFSDRPVYNGGLQISANGIPRFHNQKMLISENSTDGIDKIIDFSALQWVGSSAPHRPRISGSLEIFLAGEFGNSYQLRFVPYQGGSILKSYDGSGSGSGITASTTEYATFSGSTVTLKRGATTNRSYFDLLFQSAA